jgi:glycosyltransferase involved in cell wall biosynthesis
VVSVIVPAYNEEQVLGACIDSLLAQTGPPLEVLVVDDGSTDATAAVARARHVPVLRVAHGGPAAAKNAGAAAARGEVLVFFDADLVAEPDAVEALCRPILTGRSLGTYTAEIMVANPDNPWADCWTYNRGAARGVHFPRSLPAQWDNFRAVRREDFLGAGGYDDVGYGEDMTLAPKLRVKADAVAGARLWHHNPSTLHEVWENARWVGRGPAIHSGPRPARPRTLRPCLRRGLAGARRLGRPRFVVFAMAYDLGIRSGLRSAGRGRVSHAK